MTHISICCGHRQTVKDMLHLCIVIVFVVIETKQTAIVRILVRLVEDTQHHIQAVLTVEMSVQTGNLYDDAIVGETVYKRIR